jgi:hypothetical protein
MVDYVDTSDSRWSLGFVLVTVRFRRGLVVAISVVSRACASGLRSDTLSGERSVYIARDHCGVVHTSSVILLPAEVALALILMQWNGYFSKLWCNCPVCNCLDCSVTVWFRDGGFTSSV